MLIQVLKSKIHRVTVTEANLDYIGSITIDSALMEAAGIIAGERVFIVDNNNGERFDTYAIPGPAGSGVICLNGAAARKVHVHGEFKHLKAQAKIAQSLGIDKENVFLLSSGDVLELSDSNARITGKVPTGAILVDGLGVGDVGNVVLRDRQHLAEDGIMIVVMSLDKYSGQLVAGPDIVSRGFVYVKESDELIEEARQTVDEALQRCLDRGITDWGKLKNTTKDALGDYVWKKTKRRPMILPIIMEIT